MAVLIEGCVGAPLQTTAVALTCWLQAGRQVCARAASVVPREGFGFGRHASCQPCVPDVRARGPRAWVTGACVVCVPCASLPAGLCGRVGPLPAVRLSIPVAAAAVMCICVEMRAAAFHDRVFQAVGRLLRRAFARVLARLRNNPCSCGVPIAAPMLPHRRPQPPAPLAAATL
jgi:hypothetical protein